MNPTPLHPKLANGQVDPTATIRLGPGQPHGQIQSWEDTGGAAFVGRNSHHLVKCKVAGRAGFFAKMAQAENHAIFMQRASLDRIPPRGGPPYGGHGVDLGSVWTDNNTPLNDRRALASSPTGGAWALPCAFQQTWGRGAVPDSFEYLRKRSNSPRLFDDVMYDLEMCSTTFGGAIYHAYSLRQLNAGGQFDPIYDKGHAEDNNWGMDRNNQAFAIADCGLSGPGGYLEILYLGSTWMEATGRMPDLR